MSARDLAAFFKALFDGRLFENRRTLQVMLSEGPHKNGDIYRFGLFVKHTPRGDIYSHSGFWGTAVAYSPETGIVAAVLSTRQQAYPTILKLSAELAQRR
ncbi:serine hydrolase [Sphingomonas sp.]|jgi:D-alanyl-D-alanine carboxypeptidase|uniref:serine hydrolase n=1 Tax=Sphingomonas sp. TaxID=28214 RepID=UPI002ED9F9A8